MKSIIELDDVKFSYHQKGNVFNIKDFKVQKGEKVFLYGPSGSGKSTLLNLISGILSPFAGKLEILGYNFAKMSVKEKDKVRGDFIGYIFQSFNLIPYLTSYENIELPLRLSQLKKSKVVGFSESLNKFSKKLKIEHLLQKNVTQLSVGQQQRVAVARAFIGEPDIIVADEPTSALDRGVTKELMELLIDEHKDKSFTLLFVSHDMQLAKYFDRVISIDEIFGAEKC